MSKRKFVIASTTGTGMRTIMPLLGGRFEGGTLNGTLESAAAAD